jgi:ribosomal protein S18 acetylase RimI-like enzyme
VHAIRKATRFDAAPLSRLAESTFRETFAAGNTAENMALHCRASYQEEIQAGEIADPMMVTLLADLEQELLGFAQLRWGSAPPCVAGNAPGEILRIYVLSDWHGRGIAQALIAACLEELKARGSDVVWLGVWERNPRAIAFYRKIGFVERGEHVFPVGDDPQRDIVMARVIHAT